MKRLIFWLLLSWCWLEGMAQTTDLIRIYTDKDCYLAGEELWIKVCLDDEALPENVMSRVAYVELCDTAQVRAQGKIALQNGVGWACVQLPQTMHSGVYQLTAYTRYMRNLNAESFPRKHVAVLNTRAVSVEDRLVVDSSEVAHKPVIHAVKGGSTLKSDKNSYGSREKVSLSWPELKAKELSLSVVRKDCEVELSQPEQIKPIPQDGEHWVAECEGHIVTGRVEGATQFDGMLTQLSCVGKEMKVFEGKNKEGDSFQFYTYGVNGQQDIVLSALGNEGQAYRMSIETPFVELLPRQLPNLHCQYEDSSLISRSVALQLNQAMPEEVLPKQIEDMIYGQLPSKTYNLDEYVRFNTVQECIIEFVMGVAVDKNGDKKILRMLQEDNKDYNMFPILVLIDGVAFYNHAEVLEYNARQIHYIHQYRGNYALGEKLYGGILSLITHRGTMPDMRINSDMQMLTYEFPQDRPDFDMPDYGNEEARLSRKPDFRHTLYWNPTVERQANIEFYTSDLKGTYVATLVGIDDQGKGIELECEFNVK